MLFLNLIFVFLPRSFRYPAFLGVMSHRCLFRFRNKIQTVLHYWISNKYVPQVSPDHLKIRINSSQWQTLSSLLKRARFNTGSLYCFIITSLLWTNFPTCTLTWLLFEQFPFLNKTGENIDKIFENWKKYKYSVPVYGAILLNQSLDKVTFIFVNCKL